MSACTSSQQSLRYPGRLFGVPKLVCAKQWLLEECTTAAVDAAVEDREAEEQTVPPSKRQRVDDAQPYLTPVETSFSRRLINYNRKKIEFLRPRIKYQKKTILTSLVCITSVIYEFWQLTVHCAF